MKIKLFLLIVALLSINSLGFAQKKNILVVIIDDLGYHDLSSKGSNLYETPNIDALASQGLDFNNAYVSHPRCVSSRFALQTSRFPGSRQVPGGKHVGYTMGNELTIGQAFKNNGYETFFAGKWHLGKTKDLWPQNRGYDINIAGCSAGAPSSYFYPYNGPIEEAKKSGNKNKSHGKEIVGLENGKEGEYLTDRLTDETIKFIEKKHSKPFFAILNHYGVHTPLQAPKSLVEKYEQKIEEMSFEGPSMKEKDGETKLHQDNAVYAAMIESVDISLGRLVKSLKDQGLYENTIIVFSSDHGGLSNRGIGNNRIVATSNLPLRAGKGHSYEGGIKVPLIIAGGVNFKIKSSDVVTSNIDLMPTLLDLCDLEPVKKDIDGVSILPYIDGSKELNRTLFWHSPRARIKSTGDNHCTVIRKGNYKLFNFYKEGLVELYDLSKDPNEKNNVASSNEKIVEEMLEEMNSWKAKVNAID